MIQRPSRLVPEDLGIAITVDKLLQHRVAGVLGPRLAVVVAIATGTA